MATICTDGLSPMARGRLEKALEARARYDGVIRTLGEQDAYEARLAARRYYYVDGWQVPKIVWDAVESGQ